MFCPKCATQNVDGSSFCRSCGANISLIPQALEGRLDSTIQTQWRDRKSILRKRQPEASMEQAVQGIVMGVAFTVVSILVSKYAPGGAFWWFWLLIPAFGCFAKGFAALARVQMTDNQTKQQLSSVRQKDLPSSNTGELMPPAPSVTEGTTRHLGVDPQTRPFEFSDTQKPS